MTRSFLALSLLVAVGGCARDRGSAGAPPTATPPATTPAATASSTPAPLRLGEPISASAVSLVDVATHPTAYRGKTFATSGTVTAVCQEMGCWMEIRDDRGQAHIRMHGHSFFVPKTASGHHARVQATLVEPKDATECDDEARSDASAALAKLDLDATGVELE